MTPGQESVDQWLAENYTPPFKRQESAHDPLCEMSGWGSIPDPRCECPTLRAARADERKRIAQEIEERIADDPHFQPWADAMEEAARIARGGDQ